MEEVWPQLVLVLVLVVINGVLAGSEIALISLRDAQVTRLARGGGAGEVVARLTRDPNRFLSTIQVGITLAGFLASATAAVTLAEPLVPLLEFLGDAARSVAIVVVTLLLSFFTLVLGELAPKRLALQRAEAWSLLVGRPLQWMAKLSTPVVWLLSVSTDAVVRLLGGEPTSTREQVDLEELREMVTATGAVSSDHQSVLMGAFEVADRTLREVLVPRPDVFSLRADADPSEALTSLLDAGYSRAPVIPGTELDEAVGVVHLRDLVTAETGTRVGDLAEPVEALPESVAVLAGMRTMQERRQHLALVVDEFGGIDGIVTLEDLLEEVVGEIYDEVDRDISSVAEESEGSVVVEGRFPVHDLSDVGIHMPPGDYTTVAGLVLDHLGHLPEGSGDRVVVGDWEITVLSVRGRSIRRVRFSRLAP